MSPIAEPTVLDLRSYTLRHVGPRSVVWPDSPAGNTTVLNRDDFVARPLPTANIPNSVDFAQGKWTGRMYDSGDMSLTFPNKEASDGVPWRYRFSPDKKLQWIELWLDEFLEFVCVITKVTPDRNQVLVEGYDAFQLSKSAYERDWIVTKAPRDVIERGTQLWVPTTVDNFPPGLLSSQWTASGGAGTSASIGPSGGLLVEQTNTSNTSTVASAAIACSPTQTWRATCTIGPQTGSGTWSDANPTFTFTITEDSHTYAIQVLYGEFVQCLVDGTNVGQVPFLSPPAQPFGLMIESDGEWLYFFIEGQLIPGVRRASPTTSTLKTSFSLAGVATGTVWVTVYDVLTDVLQPFLM